MRLFNKLFLGFYLCFCFTAAQAQYRFDSWTTDNGLPQNTVLSIVKTRDGYLWAGTYEGLTRFDGVGFTVFDSVNTPEMKSNFVEVLLEDRAGNLWIGIDGGGLLRRTDNQFTRYSKSEGLPSDNVMSLLEDRAGNLWIGTDGGLSLLRDGKLTNFTAQDGLPDENIRALAEDDEGSLWLGTDKGLARLKDGKFTVYTQNDDLTNNRVRSLWWSQTDGLWIGTASGLNRWQNNRFIEFGAKEEAVNLNIQCVVEDSAGVLWIGTDRRGLFRLKQNELISESKTIGGLADESIPTIYRDSEETIWVGGYTTGLNRFREARFRTFSRADGVQEDDVKAVYEDRTGNLWFGTNKTLYRLTEGILKIYSPVETFLNQISTIAEDRDGNLWFGGNGITRYQNGQFTHFTTKDGLSDGNIHTALGDRTGNLWIGTFSKGLNLLRDGRFTVYTTRDGLVNDYVISLFEDRAGALWIGTRNGLSRFQNGQFTNWTTADGLSRDHILSYYEDAGGALWLGTSGGGLNRYKDGQFATVTSRDGLYDNLAFKILDDANGNIWMSGNKGIYRANLQELNDFADGRASSVTSYSYGTADGMLSRECNGANPAGWKTRDGNLWFPTVKGLVIINPQEYNTEPPAIVIEQAKVDKAAQPIGEAIQITPEQENLEIKYTAISWQRPQQIKFKYQLVGLDQDWTDAGTRRTAYYSHLPAGEYTFKVIADNGDGVWNLEGKSLRVSVLPPFYQTVWFYALCVLAICGAAFVVYKIRINRLEKAHRAQEDFSRRLINAHEAERSRVAAELHDSIGQTLAMIKNRAVFGTQTTENLAAAHEQFDAITAQTMQAIGEVREISYNLRPYLLENLGLTKAIKSLVHKIEEVHLLTIDARICDVDNLFAPEAEMSVYRIVQESLNNVAKHAEADEAALIIEKTNAIVTIKIADDGRGFDKNAPPKTDAEKGGFGLLGIAERVRMLNGSLDVQTKIGSGTKLTIKIAVDGKIIKEKMAEQIKIVLADDHPIVRQGLKQMIETDPNLLIVAEAGDGETALELIEKHQPDVAVLDVDMPKMGGFAVVRELRDRKINVKIVFLTMHGEREVFQAALDLNVQGYVLKDSAVTDIVASIKSVAENRPFFSHSLSALLLNRRRNFEDFENENHGLNQLTPTERRILKLIADEKTSKEIGEQLYTSHRTVEKHRANISRKLDLQGSLALVKFAVAHKFEL